MALPKKRQPNVETVLSVAEIAQREAARRDYYDSVAVSSGAEALARVHDVLRNRLQELERQQERYAKNAAFDGREAILNEVINDLAANLLVNCRLDMLANAQARLAVRRVAKEG